MSERVRAFWSLDRVAQALGTGPRGATPIVGVSTDTRTVGAGELFVALVGERFDGHEFLHAAVERGCAGAVVSSAIAGLGIPLYVVPNTQTALGALGRYRRRAWGKPVVAVAGSNGKTTTKELLRAALGSMLTVHATQGNLNNQIGVPLTLLALPDDADIAVVEVGTNEPGEIALLRAITEPNVAVMTSIGEEHLEGLRDLAGVLAEESAVFDGVELAVVPAAQPEIGVAARGRAQRVVSAGLDAGDVRAEWWTVGPDGSGELGFEGTTISVPLRGAHNLRNAMLAMAVARAAGVSVERAAAGIAAMPSPSMRSAWETLGRATLINDAYNANPASARAALDLLAAVGGGRQRVAVLGTMRELGAEADAMHDEIARRALGVPGVDIVAGIGAFAPALEAAAAGDPRVVTATDVDELWPRLAPRLAPDAVILLKASRGVRLERLVPHLTDWARQ
ncbi:MAG TPA: UDP-N-acetylmuramoyl-tripeptide--D-alanyl-D-alanine ligase [Gemmatimonadaceae bacterium]|nr:UDP-N-acetylmuramoyl-tripeptide--D-alanyl-D-alanine ligase [Gemmatimonadaceae bacterium]